MMKTDEVLEDISSYFPYQINFRIVTRSCYSAVDNPLFYEFILVAGALLRSQRLMNAKHLSDAQKNNILLNCGVLRMFIPTHSKSPKCITCCTSSNLPRKWPNVTSRSRIISWRSGVKGCIQMLEDAHSYE